MTRRRFIADRTDAGRAWLTGPNAAHLARVLRAQPGDAYEIATTTGVRLATIASVSDELVEFALGDILAADARPETRLLLAVYKYDRLEWAIEKAVELSVTVIVPVLSRRTDAHLAASAAKRVERWRRIARESAQQSRQPAAPTLADPVPLSPAIAAAAHLATRILLSEYEHATSLWQALPPDPTPLALALGPIGGWTDDELRLFTASGWIHATLGPSILRAETATIAALAILAQRRLTPRPPI